MLLPQKAAPFGVDSRKYIENRAFCHVAAPEQMTGEGTGKGNFTIVKLQYLNPYMKLLKYFLTTVQ